MTFYESNREKQSNQQVLSYPPLYNTQQSVKRHLQTHASLNTPLRMYHLYKGSYETFLSPLSMKGAQSDNDAIR